MNVIYSDGRKSKLPIVFYASGVDASNLVVPEASLVCLSFRANSQAMVDSWSKPFYDAFSESKSVQLYELHASVVNNNNKQIKQRTRIEDSHAGNMENEVKETLGNGFTSNSASLEVS
ncbi:hypothetical protein PVK06_004383 [Gossypium arboreum]|uniref:Uncharacterized protein n=1 Tax=Gossypium arboreum TaxID=29729 RepID=A0ABR0QRV7_GOSAR|nr:hypothetical protein PVK06_004383 [Gossypium arboreum]